MSQLGLSKGWPACYLKWACLRLAFLLSHMGIWPEKGWSCLLSKVGLCKGGPACSLKWACVRMCLLAISCERVSLGFFDLFLVLI